VLESPDHINRSWFAPAMDLKFKGHLILAPKTEVSTDEVPAGVTYTAYVGKFSAGSSEEVFVASSSVPSIYQFTPDANWDTKRAMLNDPTDMGTGLINGVETIVVATGSEVEWSTDPSDSGAWDRQTTPITRITFYRDMVWGVDAATGNTYFSGDLSNSWTRVAQLPLPANYVQRLITGPDAAGIERLYASTNVGLWVYDNENERWLQTALRFPFHPNGGKGCVTWRGSIFLSAGLGIYRYTPGATTEISVMGLDRDDGLPWTHQGHVTFLIANHNYLFALVTNSNFETKGGLFRWDEIGWDMLYSTETVTDLMYHAVFASAGGGVYRLFWTGTDDGNIHWMRLPLDIQNRFTLRSDVEYASSGAWQSPWFEKSGSQNFTAHQVIVNSDHPTSSETLEVRYALDYLSELSAGLTTIATKSVTGETKYLLPSSQEPTGVDFRAFRFSVIAHRGETDSNTPDLKQISLVFSKNLQPVWQFAVQLDLSESVGGYSPREMRQELERLITSNRLTEFTYRNEDGGAETHFVKVLSPASTEQTGHMEHTQYQLALVEPVPQAES
jgi:hypothetical protein